MIVLNRKLGNEEENSRIVYFTHTHTHTHTQIYNSHHMNSMDPADWISK